MAQSVDTSRRMAESFLSLNSAPPTKPPYRSFKKKYAKLRVRFAHQMKESESLIREELRIEDLSNRIKEQNDQLLEVLLEFNDSVHVPSNLRYDLSSREDRSFRPNSEEGPPSLFDDTEGARIALERAKKEMMNGLITTEDYRNLEDATKRGKAFAPDMHYTSLLNIPHTTPMPEGLGEADFERKLGFFTAEHEADYYLALDAKLGDESAALQLSRAPEKPSFATREKDASLRNPVSVYNWLRKNQPHIFLQDHENVSEKSSTRPSNVRSSKRPSAPIRKDEDTHDEDGSVLDAGATPGGSKGKRKREEDASYRPKGGSSRSSRKKKDEGAASGKRNPPKKT